MSGYIRLPRDSEEHDRQAIGPEESHTHSSHSGKKTRASCCPKFLTFMRFLGMVWSFITIFLLFFGFRGVTPAALTAVILSLIVNQHTTYAIFVRWQIRKAGLCPDCSDAISNHKLLKWFPHIAFEIFLMLFLFSTGIALIAEASSGRNAWSSRANAEAAGSMTFILSFIHLSILFAQMPRFKFEVKCVCVKSNRPTPASSGVATPQTEPGMMETAPEHEPLTRVPAQYQEEGA